jgi:hypothetical protein
MNAAAVSRTLSLIPERLPRVQSGTAFNPAAIGACAHPDRVAHLAHFLEWLGPLREVTKEDLRVFGLMTPYGKPAIESAAEEDIGAERIEPEHPTEPEAEGEPEREGELS